MGVIWGWGFLKRNSLQSGGQSGYLGKELIGYMSITMCFYTKQKMKE